MKKAYAVEDSDGHWYVIPFEMKEQFFELDEKIGNENWSESQNADEEFNKLFSQYKTGGDLNLIELYADI